MTLRDLVRGDRDDPFEGLLAPVVRSAKLTCRGGALLESVEVFAIFWGKQWAASPSAKTLIAKITQFFTDILGSTLIDQLAEYNVSGKKIGHGKFIGSKVIAAVQGWYDDANGEIGDICAWTFKRVLGWNVQLEWSNAQNKCV